MGSPEIDLQIYRYIVKGSLIKKQKQDKGAKIVFSTIGTRTRYLHKKRKEKKRKEKKRKEKKKNLDTDLTSFTKINSGERREDGRAA